MVGDQALVAEAPESRPHHARMLCSGPRCSTRPGRFVALGLEGTNIVIRQKTWSVSLALLGAMAASSGGLAHAQTYVLQTFTRQQVTDVYYSEGLGVGDLNRDGHADLVYGPYWFEGPKFEAKHEIYSPKPQNREGYANHFFAWVYDVNGDGWNDILTAGFPGTPGFVYENPRAEGHSTHWTRHEVFPHVCNESPQFTNLVGDGRPELVCTLDGFFGYATIDPEKPFAAWTFHPISKKVAPVPFGHGLGVGDVNSDGRLDVLMKDGWFEQPASLDQAEIWTFHAVPFCPIGGADLFAYDVDGDGDNDVITSLAAHDFGLAWYEQVSEGGQARFRQHLIMGDRPEQNRYGLVFSELHSVSLADIDGDGLKDIVTGKTYYSHHKASPMWDAGAVVYWFQLRRTPEGVDWIPYKADGESGIGRQLVVTDINGDGLPDIASGGMKGAHLLIQHREAVDKTRWEAARPKVVHAEVKPPVRGAEGHFDRATGRVRGAIEAEALTVVKARSGQTGTQPMAGFLAGRWSGDAQLFWSGGKPGDRLELSFDVPTSGRYEVRAAFTMARDYATVQPFLDGQPAGKPLDLYNYPDVIASGEFTLTTGPLEAGTHRFALAITGANPSAARAYMVGIDYLRLVPR